VLDRDGWKREGWIKDRGTIDMIDDVWEWWLDMIGVG
jgi:hypothetical protein